MLKTLDDIRPLQSATLASDETLASVLHFEIEDTAKRIINHTLFAVVRKGNKAIGRTLVCHEDENGLCNGHAADMAESPIEQENELIAELTAHGLMVPKQLMEMNHQTLKVVMEHPAFFIKSPKNSTTEGLLSKLAEDQDPDAETAKAVIVKVFGLLGKLTPNQPSEVSPLSPIPSAKDIALKDTNNLEKAAKEMELIKKFGKAAMEKLAKSMNYEGQVINKTKLNSNASTNQRTHS